MVSGRGYMSQLTKDGHIAVVKLWAKEHQETINLSM
jgi:hypothetical protein